jgi:hypothetical protein
LGHTSIIRDVTVLHTGARFLPFLIPTRIIDTAWSALIVIVTNVFWWLAISYIVCSPVANTVWADDRHRLLSILIPQFL